MSNNKSHFLYSVIILILFQVPPECCDPSVFAVENDLIGIFNNHHEKEVGFSELHDLIKSYDHSYIAISKSTSQPFASTIDNTIQKTWNMGTRITRRQYEIINMLFRKTKIFVEQTDASNREVTRTSSILELNNITTKTLINLLENKHSAFTTRLPVNQITSISTPSNIEFYYFNDLTKRQDNKEDTNKKCIVGTKCKRNMGKALNFNNTNKFNSSFVVFHIKGPTIAETKRKFYKLQNLQTIYPRNIFFTTRNPNFLKFLAGKNNTQSTSVNLNNNAHSKIFNITHKTVINHPISGRTDLNSSCPMLATKSQGLFSRRFLNNVATIELYKKTTAYDKIKFFEIYDRMTPTPNSKKKKLEPVDYDEELKKQNEAQNEKILLLHVDQSSHGHDKAKHSKKHIREDQNQNLDKPCLNSSTENKKPTRYVMKTKNVKKNATYQLIEFERKPFTDDMINTFSNKTAQWSEYPFAAVFIYEPSKIHCDAAGISAHWLVASGSCLSRLNKNPNGEGRSAFVTYCGENWWQPERVSYVKYSLVHPWFHPTDKARRHLYNVGVIHVVTSLRACSGWAPVGLMSHHFTTAQEGTLASAIGWGLDRFDARSSAPIILPKTPLTIYKSRLFSDSCPGNYEYSNAELFDDTGYIKSLYCLSLPPYFGEERDPIHGGLLLVDGKLIALYLQEERRPWGAQSAQYTGIWRLIPWIADVAREKEDIETSFIDI